MPLQDLPIKRKLTTVMMMTSIAVLLVTAAGFITYEIFNLRHNLRSNSESIAVIAADESEAAVAAGNQKAAQEILANFSAKKQILLSAIYVTNGLLVRYPTNAPYSAFPAHPADHDFKIVGRAANIFVPILRGNKQIGIVYFKWDLSLPYQRFSWYAVLVVALLISSIGLALVISNWLQGIISGPILNLAAAAKSVAASKDFSTRVPKSGTDEIGQLTEAFNEMLVEIQDNETALRETEAQLRSALQAAEAATKEVRALNAELETRVSVRTSELASANRELEAFTYSVSHDLRAPLRHIDAFAQILDSELGKANEAAVKGYLSRIRKGAQNMGRLVDDLLNLSKVGRTSVKKETVDLNTMVEEVRNELRAETADRQIEWRISPLPSATGDPGLIKQIFVNLISNAVKYSRPRAPAIIEVGIEPKDGVQAIFVRDNGVGFNMKYSDKLFGVFQRLHREDEFEGTGVGLATVKRIVDLEGGRIWVDAELDKGATFHFTLGGLQAT